jgi:hypothetical protein
MIPSLTPKFLPNTAEAGLGFPGDRRQENCGAEGDFPYQAELTG